LPWSVVLARPACPKRALRLGAVGRRQAPADWPESPAGPHRGSCAPVGRACRGEEPVGEVTFVAAGAGDCLRDASTRRAAPSTSRRLGKADGRLPGIAACGVAARMRGDPARPASGGRQMVTRPAGLTVMTCARSAWRTSRSAGTASCPAPERSFWPASSAPGVAVDRVQEMSCRVPGSVSEGLCGLRRGDHGFHPDDPPAGPHASAHTRGRPDAVGPHGARHRSTPGPLLAESESLDLAARVIATWANGQPAFGFCVRDPHVGVSFTVGLVVPCPAPASAP
jgi:hypothetical protein